MLLPVRMPLASIYKIAQFNYGVAVRQRAVFERPFEAVCLLKQVLSLVHGPLTMRIILTGHILKNPHVRESKNHEMRNVK
jgi:hypothetical protein